MAGRKQQEGGGAHRRGYLFTLDAVIAVLMLILVATVILSQLPKPSTDFYTDRMASDVINVLDHARVSDLCVDRPGCDCPHYPELEKIACSGLIRGRNESILELFSEIILTGASGADDVEEAIHEIFMTKNVIDEDRFGLALLYTFPGAVAPLELYNTETYS